MLTIHPTMNPVHSTTPSETTVAYTATPSVTESGFNSAALVAGIMIPVSVGLLVLLAIGIVWLLVIYSAAHPKSRIRLFMIENGIESASC